MFGKIKKTHDLFPLVLIIATLLLAVALKSIFEDLLKSVVLQAIGKAAGVTEIEVATRLTQMAVPAVVAICIVMFVYQYVVLATSDAERDPQTLALEELTAALTVQNKAMIANSARGAEAEWADDSNSIVAKISDFRYLVAFEKGLRATPTITIEKISSFSPFRIEDWSKLGFAVQFDQKIPVGHRLIFTANARR